MKRKERNQLWRIPLIVSAITGIVYLIIYLSTGSIPAVDKLVLFKVKDAFWGLPLEYALPFSMSRAWDIVFAFIFTFLIVRAIQYVKKSGTEMLFSLLSGLIAGLLVGLTFGLGFGFGFSFASGLTFGLGFGLIFGLGPGLVSGLGFGLGLGLVSGLASGLGFGLASGLGFGLVFGLIFGLGFGLVVGLKYFFSKTFWKKRTKWLAGE